MISLEAKISKERGKKNHSSLTYPLPKNGQFTDILPYYIRLSPSADDNYLILQLATTLYIQPIKAFSEQSLKALLWKDLLAVCFDRQGNRGTQKGCSRAMAEPQWRLGPQTAWLCVCYQTKWWQWATFHLVKIRSKFSTSGFLPDCYWRERGET